LIILALCLTYSVTPSLAAPIAPPTPQPDGVSPESDVGAIRQAVEAALQSDVSPKSLNNRQYQIDEIFTSQDGSQAVIWLAPVDLETGEPFATEPTVALGQVDAVQKSLDGSQVWQITFQNQAEFDAVLQNLPSELTNQELLGTFGDSQQKLAPSAVDATTYGGYYLPWAKGLTKHLSMGANHTSCPSTCTYAFDFADGTMFPLLAAKGGTVYHWYDGCANGSTSCTNSLTIEDRSTTPPTYQIYLHLQQNTIPSNLKKAGAGVLQGQFIGNVDDTGFSTGHHLHFMVVANPYLSSSGYIWGTSVDITFKDVTINWDAATQGGRPCGRTDLGYGKCSQWQYDYTSGNQGTNPPSGDLILPDPYQTINTQTILVGGYGNDDRGVSKLSMLANYDGAWREVGPAQSTTPFAFDLDLCSANIPDGPVSLALRVWDVEGNQSATPLGIRNILKTFSCTAANPPPPCTITVDQVALFAGSNFTGACQVLGVGDYPNGAALGQVGGNNAASIQVGANVSASLFWDDNYARRGETLTSSVANQALLDRNLADNLIGVDTISSLKVKPRAENPAAPILNAMGNTIGAALTTNDSLVLSWTNAGGATKFKAELTGPVNKLQDYSTSQSWSVGSLPAGNYTWKVTGRIAEADGTTHFSPVASLNFTVNAVGGTDTPSFPVPFSDTMQAGQNGWTASGQWRQATITAADGNTGNIAWVFNKGSNYADGTIRAGDLTSPPIILPASTSYLRFNYHSQTESSNLYFDQRRVQVSQDGGAFKDLAVQFLTDDPMQTWLSSPVISLSEYAGHTVRIRFHFDVVDPNSNAFSGWFVDNVSVSTTGPLNCTESSPNDSFSTATSISVGGSLGGAMCPAGDLDFYKFTGTKDDAIQVDVVTANPAFDSYLVLLDSDGKSVLAENDDVQTGVNTNSRAGIKVPANGTYYLKVKAWNHPGAGGTDYNYVISVIKQTDLGKPSTTLTLPANNGGIPGQPFFLTAEATDNNGVKSVEFWWHNPDWLNGVWNLIGTDMDGSDGWGQHFDPNSLADGQYYAFYARARDWAENVGVSASWNVAFDRTAPTSSLTALSSSVNSTRFAVPWNASDNLGLGSFNLQYTDNGGAWQNYSQTIPGSAHQAWFTGQMGHTYAFRLQAVDVAGNQEGFPAGAETSTSVETCGPDSLETDNQHSQARAIGVDAPAVTHTFCGVADEDWVKFDLAAGQKYMLLAAPTTGSQAGPQITLYGASGSPLGVEFSPAAPGGPASLAYTPSTSGTVYMRLRSIDPAVAGNGVSYIVWVGHGTWLYFPVISR